jgi:hypothetical protein
MYADIQLHAGLVASWLHISSPREAGSLTHIFHDISFLLQGSKIIRLNL